MASTTGIELKPESCVLVGVRGSRALTSVFALHLMDPGAYPRHEDSLVASLRLARSRKRLPKRARVVLWGVPDPVALDDPTTMMALEPLKTAGFRIEAVMTPPQALAALAAARPRDAGSGAVAWLAINMNGAAIAIVHGTELLFARSFDWMYTPGVAGSSAQLLQRYTLVAHLAPELRQAIARVRSDYGLSVETAITCGDLPDLRSLTMPLIEELDLEVETLDSTDGLRATGRARAERFAEAAPAIRLACAAATSAAVDRPRPATEYRSSAFVAVAVLVALAGIGYVYWSTPAPRISAPGQSASSASKVPAASTRGTPPPAAGRSGAGAPATGGAAVSPPAAGATEQTGKRATGQSTSTTGALPSPASGSPAPSVAGPSPKPLPPAAVPPASTGIPGARSSPSAPPAASATRDTAPPRPPASLAPSQPRPLPQSPSAAAPVPRPTVEPAPQATPSTNSGTRGSSTAAIRPPADNRVAKAELPPVVPKAPPLRPPEAPDSPSRVLEGPPAGATRTPPAARLPDVPPGSPSRSPALRQGLKEPLPRVDSILIDRDRRLAIVDGAILAVGDEVGLRTVVRIEREAVFLREPSGVEVRVPLRSGSPR